MISITVLSLSHVPPLPVITESFLRTTTSGDFWVLFYVWNSLLEYSLKGWTKKLPSYDFLFLALVIGTLGPTFSNQMRFSCIWLSANEKLSIFDRMKRPNTLMSLFILSCITHRYLFPLISVSLEKNPDKDDWKPQALASWRRPGCKEHCKIPRSGKIQPRDTRLNSCGKGELGTWRTCCWSILESRVKVSATISSRHGVLDI